MYYEYNRYIKAVANKVVILRNHSTYLKFLMEHKLINQLKSQEIFSKFCFRCFENRIIIGSKQVAHLEKIVISQDFIDLDFDHSLLPDTFQVSFAFKKRETS